MSALNEDKIQKIHFDLERMKSQHLNESFTAQLGMQIQLLLNNMFGGSMLPADYVSVSGQPDDVAAFANAVGSEKNFIETASKYGLGDPRTYRDKAKLTGAVSSFERTTGLKWPFN
jgi:hypothetical protein